MTAGGADHEMFREVPDESPERRDDYNEILLGERSRTLLELRRVQDELPEHEGFRFLPETVSDLIDLVEERGQEIRAYRLREEARSEAVAKHSPGLEGMTWDTILQTLSERVNTLIRKGGILSQRVRSLAEFYADLDDAPGGAVPSWDLVALALTEWDAAV